MAKKPVNKAIKAKILGFEDDPIHKGRTIVSVEFKKGTEMWRQGFSFIRPDRPISVEEFLVNIKDGVTEGKWTIEPPTDPFKYLKEAEGKELTLSLDEPTDDII